jgi:hypothetical protein
VASAPANQTFKRSPHFGFRRMRIGVQKRFCRQHPAVEAVAALESLLVDKCLLDRIGIFR